MAAGNKVQVSKLNLDILSQEAGLDMISENTDPQLQASAKSLLSPYAISIDLYDDKDTTPRETELYNKSECSNSYLTKIKEEFTESQEIKVQV